MSELKSCLTVLLISFLFGLGCTKKSPTESGDSNTEDQKQYKIAFSSSRDQWEIYVMNTDGTNQQRLTNNSTISTDPAWSPDGTKIAFISYKGSNREIYVINADGTNQKRLTDNLAYDQHPVWSPDGTQIAYISSSYYL